MRPAIKLTIILIAASSIAAATQAQQLDTQPEVIKKTNNQALELQARRQEEEALLQRNQAVAREELARALVRGHPNPPKMEKTAYLGVALEPLDAARRDELKLPRRVGVAVNHVEAGSPAEQGGIKPGDVLEKLNDQILFDMYQVTALVRSMAAGDEVKVTVVREKEKIVIAARLVEKELLELEDPNAPRPAQALELPPNHIFVQPQVAPLILDGVNNDLRDLVAVNRGFMVIGERNGNRPPKVPPGRLEALTWSDDEHVFEVTATSDPKQRARELHLVVKAIDGTFLFDGPINTPDEQKALPRDVAEKLQVPNVAAILDFMRGVAKNAIKAEPLRR